jgi:hypothetical protein
MGTPRNFSLALLVTECHRPLGSVLKRGLDIFPPFEQATMSHRSVLLLASANSPFCDFRDGAQSCDWTNYRRVIELRIAGVFPVAVPDALRAWHLNAMYPMVHDWPKKGRLASCDTFRAREL